MLPLNNNCVLYYSLTASVDEENASMIFILENSGRVPEAYIPFSPLKQGIPAATEIPAPETHINGIYFNVHEWFTVPHRMTIRLDFNICFIV